MNTVADKLISEFNDHEENVKVEALFLEEEASEEKQKLLVKISGSLDTSNSDSFYRLSCGLIKNLPFLSEVVFDLLRLEYISSTGVGALINILSFGRQKDVDLSFCNVNAKIMTLIDALGLASYLKITGTA